MVRRETASLSINKILLLLLASCLVYTSFLLVQKQHSVSADQAETGPGGGGTGYAASYDSGKRYQCDGSTIYEVLTSGFKTSLKDCAADGSTCYSLQDDTKQQSYATCLGNPVADLGQGCPTQAEITANRQTTPAQCRYFKPSIDIYDTNISDTQLATFRQLYTNSFVGKAITGGGTGTTQEFDRRIKLIVDSAKEAGFNPVLFLGYWRSESAFSTVLSASDLGCAPGSNATRGFDNQVKCAMGLAPFDSPSLSPVALCASPKDHSAASPACKALQEIRTTTTTSTGFDMSNAAIYRDYPINYPISTFDDFAEAYGPKSPLLLSIKEKANGVQNNNCVHTYNEIIEVATQLGACKASPGNSGGGNLASCKFTRGTDSAVYASQKLIGYFDEVSSKTGVPGAVLAAITKVESTTGQYNISNYTDSDISQMENTSQVGSNIDQTIAGTTKALCPRSSTGALGLMQIQPQQEVLDQEAQANPQGQYNPNPNAHCDTCVQNGLALAKAAGVTTKTYSQLNTQDYCQPKLSLYLGAGFVLKKLQANNIGDGQHWDPQWTTNDSVLTKVAQSYYGNDAQTQLYVDSLIASVKSCSIVSGGNSGGNVGGNVGGNTGGNPASASCPIQTGTVLTGSYNNPVLFGPELAAAYPPYSGHCDQYYGTGGGTQCTDFPDGTKSAIDVYLDPMSPDAPNTVNDFAEIKFPTIHGHIAQWDLIYHPTPSSRQSHEQIQGYSVTDLTTNDRFYVQFHHTKPDSGVASGKSGDHAAIVCGDGCGERHTHVQIQSGQSLGAGQWLDASQFFCRNNTRYTHYRDSQSSPGY